MQNDALDKKLIYPELSYQVVGAAFKVFNELGWVYKEIYYQRALTSELDKQLVKYQRELIFPLKYNGKTIGKYIADFIIDDKIIIELKVRPKMGYIHLK